MLWWGDQFGRHDYRDGAKLAREAGLFVENVHVDITNTNKIWLDNLDGRAVTEYYLKCADECAAYELPAMVVHLSQGDDPPPYNVLGLDRVKRIAEKAEQCGVNIAFENIRSFAHLKYVLDNVDSPRVGLCFDSGHQHCRSPEDDVLAAFGSRLMALHLHDNMGHITGASEEDSHLLPFDGTIDWTAAMRKIAETGYTGAIAIEAENKGYEALSAEEFLRLAFERARRLRGLFELHN
jgi:sugar phosphate isomerase/epimerase